MSLQKLDQKLIWHPFTQMREWESRPPLIIESARGAWLKDTHGKRYLDGVSSLWVIAHGHREPAIDRAIQRQLKKVAHSTFLGVSHPPAIHLAKELLRIAPSNLSRVFYSDNGSTAVEVAIKMAYQYSRRPCFLTLKNAYHGDTIGAVSVGAIPIFHSKFRPLLFKNYAAMSPYCYRCPFNKEPRGESACRIRTGRGITGTPKPGNLRPESRCHWQCLSDVERILKRHHRQIAAAIIEPLNQAAAGMLVMPEGYLAGYAGLARKYGVLLIADEVATGFGRTGTMFAVEQEGVRPDFLCLSKTLTGGYLPLAATLTTEKVYRAFLGRYDEFKSFFHGHTYTANPLGCAAALANLELYRKKRWPEALATRILQMSEELRQLSNHPHVGSVRQLGMMVGIELVADKATGKPFPIIKRVGVQVCLAARRRGVLLRPLGDVIVLMPPLGTRASELRFLFQVLRKSMEEALGR